MTMRLFLASFFVFGATAAAAEIPAIPATSIAEKKELLFSEDFEGAVPAKVWHKVVPTFVVERAF